MEAFGIIGMTLGVMGMGLGAFVFMRLERLEKHLKESGVLDKNYQ